MKNIHLSFVILILLLGCKKQKSEPLNEPQTELINYLFDDYIGEKPSASFIVIKNGEIKVCQSYGYADLANGIKANCNTNYRIASVTKQFTAMAIMKLISQGKLSYETKIPEIFPDFPEYGKEITVRQLLSHRTGLINYMDFIKEDRKEPILDNEILNTLKDLDSTYFIPNTKYKYSNTGYAVLTQIIEKITGITFQDFMNKEIFLPLEMNNSTVYTKDVQIKNRAFGYVMNDSIAVLEDQSITSAVQGDGGIYTSVNEFYKWDNALYSNKLMPNNELEKAFFAQDQNGATDKDGYGFGWSITKINGKKMLFHGGFSPSGFRTYSLRIPEENLSVAIFSNRDEQNNLREKAIVLASLFSDGKLPIPIHLLIEKEIEENGSKNISKKFTELKTDGTNYDIVEKDLTSLGFKYFSKKEDKKAFEVFTFIKSEFPTYFGGYFGLARYYKANNDKEKAIEYFKKVIEIATSEDQNLMNYSKRMIEQLSE